MSTLKSTGNRDLDAVLRMRKAEAAGRKPESKAQPRGKRRKTTSKPARPKATDQEHARDVPIVALELRFLLEMMTLDLQDLRGDFDCIAKRLGRMTNRLTQIEPRFGELERRRLAEIGDAMKEGSEGSGRARRQQKS